MGEPPWLHEISNIPQKWAINQRQKRKLFSWTTQQKNKVPSGYD